MFLSKNYRTEVGAILSASITYIDNNKMNIVIQTPSISDALKFGNDIELIIKTFDNVLDLFFDEHQIRDKHGFEQCLPDGFHHATNKIIRSYTCQNR